MQEAGEKVMQEKMAALEQQAKAEHERLEKAFQVRVCVCACVRASERASARAEKALWPWVLPQSPPLLPLSPSSLRPIYILLHLRLSTQGPHRLHPPLSLVCTIRCTSPPRPVKKARYAKAPGRVRLSALTVPDR